MKGDDLAVVLAAAVVVGAAGFVTWSVLASKTAPAGPVAVAWDRATCAECGMHVGEPAFAAQLQTADGQVLNFDDPGCAFLYRQRTTPELAAVYYHHVGDDRWIAEVDTSFLRVAQSPMGFGFGAVDAGTAGAVSLAEARAEMLAK